MLAHNCVTYDSPGWYVLCGGQQNYDHSRSVFPCPPSSPSSDVLKI